jgi:hypothetical protein
MIRTLFGHNVIRVAAAALMLSTLSFAAGVAGDLSGPPRSGERVVVRIPPELPPDTVRAAPLPPLTRTATAAAAEVRRPPRQLRAAPTVIEAPPDIVVALVKPRTNWVLSEAKPDLDRAPKPDHA